MPSSEARYVEVRLFKGKFLMFIIIRCHQFDVIFPEKLTLNELTSQATKQNTQSTHT